MDSEGGGVGERGALSCCVFGLTRHLGPVVLPGYVQHQCRRAHVATVQEVGVVPLVVGKWRGESEYVLACHPIKGVIFLPQYVSSGEGSQSVVESIKEERVSILAMWLLN